MSYTDLHSHVLPGLDDGSPDMDTSRTMIEGLAALGFGTIACTPHQKASQFLPERVEIDRAYEAVVAMVKAAGIAVTLTLGAENMWDDVFYERSQSNSIPSYGGGPAFLLEFPLTPALPAGVFEHLFQVRMAGHLPVIAHPERYEAMWRDLDLATRLSRDCAMVVNLGAVAGYHGRKRKTAARKLLKNQLVHAVASDAHTPADIQSAAEGMEWIRKKLGDDTLERLLSANPPRILAGDLPE